jgi:hypothetical protein
MNILNTEWTELTEASGVQRRVIMTNGEVYPLEKMLKNTIGSYSKL